MESFETYNITSLRIKEQKITNECFASEASKEIMLHRFFKGNKLEFPFARLYQ